MVNSLKNNKKQVLYKTLVFYAVVIALLIYEYFSKIKISGFIITCTVISLIGHTFAGKFLDLYHKSISFDRYLHMFGSFSFALLVFSIINQIVKLESGMFYIFLFVTLLGISIGVFFEIAEFIHDKYTNKPKCQHGLTDTDVDMIFNIFGSIIAGFISLYVF